MLTTVALKDDDVEGEGVAEAKEEDEEKMDTEEITVKAPKEVLPTGRVVGVMKRNWRA